ncbi:hypothetical protein AWC22_16800 [Mycobacterium riyadhense]|uniref:triphosphoribosyl-dephospho-CoA synthase n=1 Tax=Mycobacterium riyadhense TaxID=486698 RepID=A0A1X2D0Y5_9MYCO|nr:triphosphoribosyl-dephospho-CoA synthase MdcB [Mycobacterium riyadhense]ORW81339.1 hypothetical protein AWC22_16800 [Mycobacterium riyadhense]
MVPPLVCAVQSPALGTHEIADLAVYALREEAELTPKPGLVDRRGPGAHTDMSLALLFTSADALRSAFYECACAAMELDLGIELRARVGCIGRAGERSMLTATGGVNTHRGALWALGLLCAAAGAGATTVHESVDFAARLARIPDPALAAHHHTQGSHGALARRRYRALGAPGEARAAFPHVTDHALPTLRAGLATGCDPSLARHDALLALIARLDDTCLLHRGGRAGLTAIQSAARSCLTAGGIRTPQGRQRFWMLDQLCARRRLSPGGAGDLLAATVYLDAFDRRSDPSCRH